MEKAVVEDLIAYLQTLPKDMPLVTGNSYSCQSSLVSPVSKDKIKSYLHVYSNKQWWGNNKPIGRDILMIYDERHYDF